MISDNFVTGDNVYLNELRNFFFEVLGMMSITHYGAVGNGKVDNYAYLQVAIEDAHRRGLQYLYVPYGIYRYRGNLQHLEGITFMGNPRAKIFNDKTGEEIPIIQFGLGHYDFFPTEVTYMLNRGYYIDIPSDVGTKVDLTPIPGENVAYFLSPIKYGEIYEIYGTGIAALADSNLELVEAWGFTALDNYFPLGPATEDFTGYIVVSFDHTNTNEPHIWHTYEQSGGGGSSRVTDLADDIVLLAGTPLDLPTGFYRFSDSQKGLYYHEALVDNFIYGFNDGVFYFDNTTQTFNLDLKSWFYDELEADWQIVEHTNITNEIVDSRNKIPTSQAVYNYVDQMITQAIGGGY